MKQIQCINPRYIAGLLCIGCLIAVRWAMAQGSLTPPGAPAPTMKTLEQIEPRTVITNLPFTILGAGGSYYLTNHMTGVAASDGILILTDNVTVDLNGYSLIGVPGSYNGIIAVGTRRNLVLRNGTVRNWGNRGVSAGSASNSLGQGLRALNNVLDGLTFGDHSTVSDCTTYSNGWVGISVGAGSLIESCTAASNLRTGILAAANCTVQGSTATASGGSGMTLGDNSVIQGCTATSNTNHGVEIGRGAVVAGCAARGNGVQGFEVGLGSQIVDCTSYNNTWTGIRVGLGSSVTHCTVFANQVYGIVDNGGEARVTDCNADENGVIGIWLNGLSVARNNSCAMNGSQSPSAAAGIKADGSGNHIEGNTVVNNRRGFVIGAIGTSDNMVFRNVARDNPTVGSIGASNYVFAGSVVFGPTNNLSGTGGVVTNLNPWANFSY